MNKEVHVTFITEKLKKNFESLKEGRFENKQLYKFISRALDDIKENPSCSVKIPRKLWPKFYVKNHKVTNLWKYDLPNAWRLVYTIEKEEVVIFAIVIEWYSHKEYERRFKY